jgi:formate hydrogenlyase subunit 4
MIFILFPINLFNINKPCQQMQEKTLIMICLLAAALGLLALFFLLENSGFDEVSVEQLSALEDGKVVRFSGKIISLHDHNKSIQLTVMQPITAQVTLFKEKEDYGFSINDTLEITAKKQDGKMIALKVVRK